VMVCLTWLRRAMRLRH